MDFITSDLHFGHFNMIKFSNRPFQTAKEMDAGIIEKYNSTVGPHDTVYILGDFSYKAENPADYYLDQLNGKKIVIFGNHDKSQRHIIKNHPSVVMCADYHELRVGDNQWVIMSHYPLAEWNGAYNGSVMLHGHCHGTKKFVGRILDVGIDCHGKILTLSDAIAMAKAGGDYEKVGSIYANTNKITPVW